MRITFRSTYLSITSFPETNLPDFTVLTGVNGAGKTHFLQALANGNLVADCAPGLANDIRLFDFNSMVPQDTGIFSTEALKNERTEAFQNWQAARSTPPAYTDALRSFVRSHGFPQEYVAQPLAAAKLTPETIGKFCRADRAPTLFSALQQALEQADQQFLLRIPDPMRSRIRSIAKVHAKHVFELEQSDFFSTSASSWGEVNLFQQSFARLFVAYRDVHLSNELAQLANQKGQKDVSFLSDDEFNRRYGAAPWDFVNASLESAGLDFTINRPDPTSFAPFQPELTKRSSGVTISFSTLSSGEKILMAFAFCLYYSSDRRQLTNYPKILLLDEVDAPLHPSMTRSLLNTIRDTLVASHNIKVILATHSPSTVALAADESIYVMTPSLPGVHRSSRAEALNLLTVGVPTLAISFEGRRQVFVESSTDARVYDGIYKLLKASLQSERSLEFIATGTRSATGQDRNTGCEVVKRIVKDLSAAGNQSAYGLLDWDGHHQPSDRIAVLAAGRRNGLENVVLDPLAIALLICKQFPQERGILGLGPDAGFISFAALDRTLAQAAVESITRRVFGGPPTATTPTNYVGGLRLEIDTRYLTTDDHELENKLAGAFPYLKSITRQRTGVLMEHIVTHVFADVPNAIPSELFEVMKLLLERPSH
ncbi:ATP-binding protein [Bradyrhizobium sp. 160]|uniref:ATP-dependent nuclease n=1 Tax=Bradyrhizobium sp. 160 TaxID=2782634 RepID=UPI001FF92E9D|nr:ATP-binding protein [Bradyrhizobium sp. 160]MCK1627400.1 ATP-binding protein [Bradyrhizobium sp. 160]